MIKNSKNVNLKNLKNTRGKLKFLTYTSTLKWIYKKTKMNKTLKII